MTTLTLPRRKARLLYLAVAYHLARPGSEIDPQTMAEVEHGLAEVKPPLESQLDADSVTLTLTPYQLSRLSEAILGVINELHIYSVLDAMAGASPRQRSVAPGFDETLRRLFPRIEAEPDYASRLAEDMVMLRRELSPQLKEAEAALEAQRRAAGESRRKKKRWQFWKK